MSAARKVKRSPIEVTYTVECSPDNLPLKGNVMASGDDKVDAEAETEVAAQLAAGNLWAWCHVVVRAEVTAAGGSRFVGFDSLGACSYKSESDFREPGGYFDDMKRAALDDLKTKLRNTVKLGDTAAQLLEQLGS